MMRFKISFQNMFFAVAAIAVRLSQIGTFKSTPTWVHIAIITLLLTFSGPEIAKLIGKRFSDS